MDINKTLKELKQAPGFTEHVGMMLVHNGVVLGPQRPRPRDPRDGDARPG